MELKKKPSLDTSTFSNLFFTGGLVVVLGLTIFAFEYKTYEEIGKPVPSGGCYLHIFLPEDMIVIRDTTVDIPITTQTASPIAPLYPESVICIKEDKIKDEVKIVPKFELPPTEELDEMEGSPIMAKFPDGQKAFIDFINTNLQYPKGGCVEGTVYVRFIVDKDGSIIKDCVKVAKSVDPALDAEAVRVVRMSPKWTPALQNERPTKQRIRVPVKFKIQK